MKFQFKIQPYQSAAVDAVVDVFAGQVRTTRKGARYKRDLGVQPPKAPPTSYQMELGLNDDPRLELDYDYQEEIGYRNEDVSLSPADLLQAIRTRQARENIQLSDKLVTSHGCCSLDVEMETGTGKTYVYIKSMYELHARYGWSKFIVVVPSVAIREGVKKSFELMEEHFMQQYGCKARCFVYESKRLTRLEEYSCSADLQVMIINTQAFNASLKEGGRTKDGLIIYSRRDEFASRRPIDVIKVNRPIIILDEPQKMGGDKTQAALKNFNPLFTLSYSATHKKRNNLVHVLDALDAYNQRLVKKIEVKGFDIHHLRGTDRYVYVEGLKLSPTKAPQARLEFEQNQVKSIKRVSRHCEVGDDLYPLSHQMQQYKHGFTISDIDGERGLVYFLNGTVLRVGEVLGDVSEKNMRRLQIRETIRSHFEKEEALFLRGIKTLSLFFIDEVKKYRCYDEHSGAPLLAEYAQMFEEEYSYVYSEFYQPLLDTPYQRYLKEHCAEPKAVHQGYFSIDKKGHSINSKMEARSDISNDTDAYDLILKDKERLLSFDEPTRFIFSHSALREGWDNPNVFQICTLKQAQSEVSKRQEVGRGLRLCVNQAGERMDNELACAGEVHDINRLTVIASESYADFVGDLQRDMKNSLYERPAQLTMDYFVGKTVEHGSKAEKLKPADSKLIYHYLVRHNYIDEQERVTDDYRQAVEDKTLAPLPDALVPMSDGIHLLIQRVYDEKALDKMIANAHEAVIRSNPLNDNFRKAEFQALWKQINRKYSYTAHFDSEELIRNSIGVINQELFVTELRYTITKGEQKGDMTAQEMSESAGFITQKTQTHKLDNVAISPIKYDLLGVIANNAKIKRVSVAAILKGLHLEKFNMYKRNPEEFLRKVSDYIIQQKAGIIVEGIQYNEIEGSFDSDIFIAEHSVAQLKKALPSKKHIQDYIITDGSSEHSIERTFAESLEQAEEVAVYAKLPRGFHIPTPFGNYSPDWAIAFVEGSVKHIYFIAETKGSLESMQLRPIEQGKIRCAKTLFNKMSTSSVRYHDVTCYDDLLSVMGILE
ncbi:MAG: DEAD/DEAH box helicase family protein [Akkermansia sp.]